MALNVYCLSLSQFPSTFSDQSQQVLVKYLGEQNGTHLYNKMNPTHPVYRTCFNMFG